MKGCAPPTLQLIVGGCNMPGPPGDHPYCGELSVFEARALCYNHVITTFRFCAHHLSRTPYALENTCKE